MLQDTMCCFAYHLRCTVCYHTVAFALHLGEKAIDLRSGCYIVYSSRRTIVLLAFTCWRSYAAMGWRRRSTVHINRIVNRWL